MLNGTGWDITSIRETKQEEIIWSFHENRERVVAIEVGKAGFMVWEMKMSPKRFLVEFVPNRTETAREMRLKKEIARLTGIVKDIENKYILMLDKISSLGRKM